MTNTIRTLIVDDERYARDELKHLLSAFDSIQVIGEADSGEAAILQAIKHQPDVIFLDIEMPKVNGMEVAKSLLELKSTPSIIFATAHPEFAAEAFRFEAVDYLLKPYDEERLQETIERIEKRYLPHTEHESIRTAAKLAIDFKGEILYIHPDEILYICREEKITKIRGMSRSFETKTTLKEFEHRLKPYPFFRIHKSYLVNLDYVSKLSPWFNGAYQLELKGCADVLAVSRNYVRGLREVLEL
ncbi:LytR/AlgR family response regulator transcription factor [Aquibacillus kalidii]|uniref:LytR/AlgR family response regulator transcription factor n=1 Tax=Aquibacillus kalidii TaxID=2762597 RepID=UPI001647EE74|nr:LytTR family DNA-binding domain-containing protein [Aquibacillus kalidii]